MKATFKLGLVLVIANANFAYANAQSVNDDFTKYFSGSIGIVSDYVYRGVSQTDENPALQGNIDFNYDDFKLGVWSSNVDFDDGSDVHTEVDYYTSYIKEFDKLSWENGIIYFTYPDVNSSYNYNYGEVYTNAIYDFDKFTINAGLSYTPDFFANSGEAFYPKIGFGVPLPYDLIFDGSIGRQFVQDNVTYGVPDYNDWNLGLAYTINSFTIKAQYVDSNIDKDYCAENCDAKVILTVLKTF